MARDSSLFDRMRNPGTECLPAVRIYRWSTAAVTIGRLQDEDEARAHYPGLTLVRRPTGGRAVVHGDDLTITVAARDEWLPGTGGSVMASYRVIVAGVVDALRRHGIDAAIGERRPRTAEDSVGRRVDCFAAVAACDIADARTGEKLVGSAQRRDRGAVLQQMSIRGDVVRRIEPASEFVRDLRECLQLNLKIDGWEFVDFDSGL